MLNIGRLAPGGEDYYLATVATTVADYYAGRGEAPGRWVGEGSHELGLTGVVTPERLKTVLGAVDPATAESLLAHGGRRVPGFDLAFRPPKSVSLLWALSEGEVSAEARRSHDAAVDATLCYLEQEVVRSRRGHNAPNRSRSPGWWRRRSAIAPRGPPMRCCIPTSWWRTV